MRITISKQLYDTIETWVYVLTIIAGIMIIV